MQANVSLALEHHRLPAGEHAARVREALALTGLSDFADALPRQLSGGMRQRVGIARALGVRPAVLLLDEPLSALDAQTRELLMEDLLSIWARERGTRLYVTHNLDEAARLADRVAVLSRRPGRIREILEIAEPVAQRGSETVTRLRDWLWDDPQRGARGRTRGAAAWLTPGEAPCASAAALRVRPRRACRGWSSP